MQSQSHLVPLDLTIVFFNRNMLSTVGILNALISRFNTLRATDLPNGCFIAFGQARLSASELQACLTANGSPMRDEQEAGLAANPHPAMLFLRTGER
ncbi:hypothetical protein BSZ31_04305 [Limnobacter sp. SAORIC-690]|jgi:hypothetical protein|nr:hypothetical protein BSZ31_04305 [Limnobacter sp. SAORIC-690]